MHWMPILLVSDASGAENFPTGLVGVTVVTLIIWAGIFLFLLRLDRRLRRLEKELKEQGR